MSIGEPYHVTRGISSRGRILARLERDDFIAFYASFRPIMRYAQRLAYCLIGIFFVQRVTHVKCLSPEERHRCAHGRRKFADNDLVIWAAPASSGRFSKAIPIGEYRRRAYRVQKDLLAEWGGLTVKDGYIQRSAVPPRFSSPTSFLAWLNDQEATCHRLHRNS